MKFSVLLSAAILAFASVTARAEVLVYSGTAKVTELGDRKRPLLRKAFLVTDPAAKSTQLITYGKSNRIKSRNGESPNVGDYFGGALGTALVDIYTFIRTQDNLGILRQSIFLRGYQKTVQVSLSQDKPVTAVRAKFLKGSTRLVVAGLGSSYVEQELSLVLDKERTVDANLRGLSAADTYDDIAAFLEARGYTEL